MDKDEPQTDPVENPRQRERLKHRVLKAGESFGNYRVVRCLCAGLIANYYHMQHVRDLRDVTVGVFHPRTLKEPKFGKRLQALQKTIAACGDEGIPKVREVEEINERHCVFMDFVSGQSLSHYFGGLGTPGQSGVGADKVARILAQLLGILGHAHSLKMDHRDLDSDLIFVQEDGGLRVLGMGVKAALGVELFESIVSASVSPLVSMKTAGRLNSFDVMSPEYRSGVAEDHRVDIYCAGVIGYWLLTGMKPEASQPSPVTTKAEGLNENWNVFLNRCLRADREERYASCKTALLGLKATEREPESERAGFIQRQIDRIPVPKSILARGELAARVYRLSMIGLVGLTFTAIMASFLQVTFTETGEYERKIAILAQSGETPNLRLYVDPPVARVRFERSSDRFIATEGRLEFRVLPGEYTVWVTAPHHVEESVSVTVDAGGTREMSVDLKPAWTDFEILTEPDATVSVVDERGLEIELGVADETGVFHLKKGIFAGVYRIVVRKDGYRPTVLDNQELSFGEMTEVEAPLVPLPASLVVRTEPGGASVTVNESELGRTPLTVEEVEPSEHYLVVVRREGYRPIGRRVTISAGEDKVVDFGELTPLSGSFEFEVDFTGVSDEAEPALLDAVEVELDGERRPYGDRFFEAVPAGEHEVRLLHPLYESQAFRVVLEDREVERIEAEMRPKPAIVELDLPGNLEAEVRIDSKKVAMEEPGRVKIPADEAVELELRIANHLTMTRRFELGPNEHYVWEVDPVRIPGPTRGQSWTMPYLGLRFVWVDPGSYTMGSPPPEPGRLPNEGPLTEVRFTEGFWIGAHEVTQAQYHELTETNPSGFRDPSHPVENVTWADARVYCDLLTKFERDAERLPEGYAYRLPTEAEWEYAARAGTKTPFFFGERADASKGVFCGVYPPGSEDGLRVADHYGTRPVGTFAANAWGLYDVHGNVEEWTADRYNGRLEGGSMTDPAPRADGDRISVRGGSWEDFAVRVRSAVREGIGPETESDALGFRVVLAPER